MRISLDSKYRKITKITLWTLSIGSIIIAFFSIPILFAVIFAVICVSIPLLIERIVFRYNIVWVFPELTTILFNRLGFTWFYDENNGNKTAGFAIIFERKYEAKHAYAILKSWNYNQYIDKVGNISVTFIDEGDNKFSVFLYPGVRKVREEQLLASIKKDYPRNSEFKIDKKVFIWIQNCGDYSDRPEMLKLFQSIQESDKILLNTAYVVNNEIKSYAKRNFILEKIRFIERKGLSDRDLEKNQDWEDPIKKYPDNADRVSKIKLTQGNI
jgi:hypothetical protein